MKTVGANQIKMLICIFYGQVLHFKAIEGAIADI